MNPLLEIALKIRRLYWWFARPQTFGVRAIILDEEEKILLVKHQYGKGWFLPGGKVRKNEQNERALERELREEIGITSLSIERILGTYTNTQEYKKDTIIVYIIKKFNRSDKSHFEIESKDFFAPSALPETTSPGTRRRIQEFLGKQSITTTW